MKQLNDLLNDFDFSDALKKYVANSKNYATYQAIPEKTFAELDQQKVSSANHISFIFNKRDI